MKVALDEVIVKINGKQHYLWRAVDHEGEVLECFVTKRRDRKAALTFLKKAMKRHGNSEVIVTDRFDSRFQLKPTINVALKYETVRLLIDAERTRSIHPVPVAGIEEYFGRRECDS